MNFSPCDSVFLASYRVTVLSEASRGCPSFLEALYPVQQIHLASLVPLSIRGAHRDSARSTSAGSTGYLAFHASKPPSRAAALKPNLFSLRAARALVASSGQVQ
jgi:hypothetical protein